MSPDASFLRQPLHGLRYTIVDGRVVDARAMLEDVAGIVEEAKGERATGGR